MATQNKVQENLLKLLYAGVGLAAQTAEKAQSEIETLIEKGKVSEHEGKKIVDDLLKKTESERGKIEKRFQEAVKNVAGVTTKELSGLISKIEKLEGKVGAAKPAAAAKKPAAKKSARKR